MTIQCKTLTVLKKCTSNWQCEIPLNGYEYDGCGNRRLNIEGICGIIRGTIIQLNAINLTTNQTIKTYEWKLNNNKILLNNNKLSLNNNKLSLNNINITIDTSNLEYGDNTISLRTQNNCNMWSDEIKKIINIVEYLCNISQCDFTITQ